MYIHYINEFLYITIYCPKVFLPSWSSHCQSTPRTTLAPGNIPLAVTFLLFRRASQITLYANTKYIVTTITSLDNF